MCGTGEGACVDSGAVLVGHRGGLLLYNHQISIIVWIERTMLAAHSSLPCPAPVCVSVPLVTPSPPTPPTPPPCVLQPHGGA
jgi:hypothetical protein